MGGSMLDIPPYEEGNPDQVPSEIERLRLEIRSHDSEMQTTAAAKLLELNDKETILRLVYSLKGRNSTAARLLKEFATPAIIPFLSEEIAHGDMGFLDMGDTVEEPIRQLATDIAVGSLMRSGGLPSNTRMWLEHLSEAGKQSGIGVLSQRSEAILQWWAKNNKAVESGDLGNANWLPEQRLIKSGHLAENADTPIEPVLPESPEPSSEKKHQNAESFEEWSSRIQKTEGRDLTFEPLFFGLERGRGKLGPSRPEVRTNLKSTRETDGLKAATNLPLRSTPLSEQTDSENTLISWCLRGLLIVSFIGLAWLIWRIRIQKWI